MWELNIFGFSFFYLFYNFFIYSFFGWIYESCLVSVKNKKFVNRGFLNGTIIPIYGAGATIIYVLLAPIQDNIILVFIGGVLLATILEFVTSYVMEIIFHAKWWDYSHLKYNIQGRVCLSVSLFWGLLSILMTQVLQPSIEFIIYKIPRPLGEYLGYVIFAIFITDLTATVISTVQLDKKLAELQKLRQELSDYIEGTKLYGTKEELKAKFENSRITDFIDGFKLRLESEIDKYKENSSAKELFDFSTTKEDMEARVKEIVSKYQKKSERPNFIQKRLLKAFPNIKSINKNSALTDLKEKLHIKKDNN